MRVKYSPPGVEFEKLSFVRKATMFCRNIARQIFRFPIFFVTFLIFGLLLLSSRAPPGVAPRSSVALPNARAEDRLLRGLSRCPHVQRPEESVIRTLNGPWQRHGSRNGSEDIIAYSAFFDDRPLLGFSTWIRILAVAANVTSASGGGISCQVWYAGHAAPYVTRAQVNVTGREAGYLYERRRYVQYLFSCLLPAVEPVPTHVSVVGNQCDRSTILLPVKRPLRAEPEHEFGVCVPVSFGSLPVTQFVEWMELLHVLGVTEFNVYDGNVTGVTATAAFRLYSDRGWLRVFAAPPALDMAGVDRFKVGSAAALNDCMMRNVYRYRLLLVIDLDEVIFPRMHRSYSAMLDHINKAEELDQPHVSYSFQNAYFFQELRPDRTQPAYLRTAVHRTRSSRLRTYRVAPKSFVDPLQCLSVFNHFCLLPLKVTPGPSHLDVHPTVAVTHHYRRCAFSRTACQEFYNSSYEDSTALRFKNDLEPRVKVTLEQLGVPVT